MTGPDPRRVAITGASGYVGTALAARFERAGWTVTRLTRAGGDAVRFRLGEEVDPELFRSRRMDALVHAAYDFAPVTWTDIRRVNVEGSRKLLSAAREGGVHRIVVLSSISAFPGCRSLYGRAKLEIEQAALAVDGAVVRPGLVWMDPGAPEGGMFGSLIRSARGSLVPLIDGGSHCQYLVHIDDLFTVVSRLSEEAGDRPNEPIVAASPRCWPMRALVAELARRQGLKPRFVGVPWRVVWLGLKAAETAHVRLGYRSDSVVSLVHQDPRPDFTSLGRIGVTPRDFSAA